MTTNELHIQDLYGLEPGSHFGGSETTDEAIAFPACAGGGLKLVPSNWRKNTAHRWKLVRWPFYCTTTRKNMSAESMKEIVLSEGMDSEMTGYGSEIMHATCRRLLTPETVFGIKDEGYP